MAYVIKKGSAYSPESTVSSLLASWSLKSSRNSSVQYKDKLYTSASQALEAYIEDFDLSLTSPDVKPGKICITPDASKAPRSMKESPRGKRALGNFHAVLGPVTSHRRRENACDPDKLSLTTDDLLAFPADGSVSFTHRATLRSASQSGVRNRKSLPTSASCDHQWTSSFDNKEKLNFPKTPIGSSLQKDFSRNAYTKRILHKYNCEFHSSEKLTEKESESDLHKNYPRWLTGQKSDLSISGISSIPDFTYPMWLKSNNLLSDSSNDSSSQTPENNPTFLQDIRTFKDSQNAISSDNWPGHCGLWGVQDEDTESVLQMARRSLKSSAGELAIVLENDGSPCTVDVLEAQRSWDNIPVGLKSPVPVCFEEDNSLQSPKASIVNEFLEDCLKSGRQESTFSGGNHHGPVEALKLMLFNLQAVQHSLNQNKTAGQNEESKNASDEEVEFNLCDGDTIPVRKSLQRALHHLSRLRNLVEDTSGKDESK